MTDAERKEIGLDLYATIEDLGESIYFEQEDGSKIYCSLSIENSLDKSSITAINEYAFRGSMTFPDNLSIETLKGSYFVRELFPNKTYLLLLTSESIYDERIADVYVGECNDVISIGYTTTEMNEETFNDETVYKKIYEDIKAFTELNLKTQQSTDFGNFQTSLFDVYIPAHLQVTTQHKVFKTEYITSKTIPPVTTLGEQSYSIENTDYTLSGTLDGETFYGLLRLQIAKEV